MKAGRDPDSLDMSPFVPPGMFRTRAELAELAQAGADNTVLWLQGKDEKEILSELEQLAGAIF